MTFDPRDVTLPGQWAKNAATAIPSPPIPGTAYRKTALSREEVETGQRFDAVYDSAANNQYRHQVSGLVGEAERYGIMRWSPLTDYPENGMCMGPGGAIFQALRPSGPDSGGAKPTSDAGCWRNASSPAVAVFATPGTYAYDFTPGAYTIIATGGGASGYNAYGAPVSSGGNGTGSAGDGGASGATAIKFLFVERKTTGSLTVGQGGAGVPAHKTTKTSNPGSASTVAVSGFSMTALGGAAQSINNGIAPASGGDVNLNGVPGACTALNWNDAAGYPNVLYPASGAASFWGDGTAIGDYDAPGCVGAPGSGGGGGAFNEGTGYGRKSARGADGIIVVIKR